nr:hypothetical protein [Methylobacterium gossipiicola]
MDAGIGAGLHPSLRRLDTYCLITGKWNEVALNGKQSISVTERERDTMIAALRYYQFYRLQGNPFNPQHDHLIDAIAGQSGEALDLAAIDDLCAGLGGNKHALSAAA